MSGFLGRLPIAADVADAAARLETSGIVLETPVLRGEALDEAAGAEVFVKAECLQTTGSFKIRGAYNKLSQISEDKRPNGVVAFSSGNHAQGVARAARLLGMPALIIMPSDAPEVKVDGVKADGAELFLYDRHNENREEIAAQEAEKRGAVIVPSFDDADIVAGQGTVGRELARQVSGLDHVICCAGGGGLITGSALALKDASAATRIWTAEPAGHDDWARSLEADEVLSNEPGTRSICDAILTPEPGQVTWAIGRTLLAGGQVVTDDDVRAAVRFAFRYLKVVLEPGGAAALAVAVRGLPAEMRGTRVGIIATGGNVDATQFAEIISAGV